MASLCGILKSGDIILHIMYNKCLIIIANHLWMHMHIHVLIQSICMLISYRHCRVRTSVIEARLIEKSSLNLCWGYFSFIKLILLTVLREYGFISIHAC